MRFKTTILALCALPLVAGCNLNGSNVTSKSALVSASKNYAPVYTDGESVIFDHITTTGVTGFVGNPDGTVSEIRVRVDLEAELAYVSIDGGPEIAYDEVTYLDFPTIQFVNAAAQWAYVEFNEYGPSYIQFGEDDEKVYSEGSFGMETAPGALPTETARYSGSWNARGETDTTGIYAGGYINVAVGFASGNVTGYTEGGFESWDNDTETYDGGSFIGSVTGSVTDSRIAGTMTVDGDASGELDLMGAIYGENAEYAAGGIGGSLTSEAGTQSLGGGFYLRQNEGCGPFC